MRLPHIHIPPPEPDETLHSLLIAAFRLSGHANFLDFTKLIFRMPSDGRGWSWRYKSICAYLDPCKKTSWALLQGALQLPYLTPFMTPEAANRGDNRLDGDIRIDPDALKSAWSINNKRPLNYCPVCVVSNIRQLGRSIWLRSHQLPHVNVCWRHSVRLVTVQQRFASPLLPHEFNLQKPVYCSSQPDLWLARQTRELLLAGHQPSLPEHRKEVYRTRALRLGYVNSGRIDSMAVAAHLTKRFNREFFDRVISGTKREWLAAIVHRIVSGQEPVIRPHHHLLCIDALFGEQRLFFQQLRHVQAGQPSDVKSTSEDEGEGAHVHKSIFLHELQLSGRDVMLRLNVRFPLTHAWILKNALAWSRIKIAKLVPQSPDREKTLRAAARERRSEETAIRDRRRRALSAVGGETAQKGESTKGGETSGQAFPDMAGGLSTYRESPTPDSTPEDEAEEDQVGKD